MSKKNKYIAITIGPIFDTMNLVSSPAALWASSYIFSSVAKEICHILKTDYNIDEEQIITPYYSAAEIEDCQSYGVGLYPDHIIFQKPDGFDVKSLSKIKEKVIKYLRSTFFANLTVKDNLGSDHTFTLDDKKVEAYFNEYLMISAAEFQTEEPYNDEQGISEEEKERRRNNANPILKSSKMLDCLELAKPFVRSEKNNFILERFTGDEKDETDGRLSGKNELIKAIVKDKLGINNWQLLNGDRIKNIPSIACVDDASRKYNDYCVIVRADGDNVGQIISRLNVGEIRDFSKCCLDYCMEAAKFVKSFGGVTIYSGGDDLLALMPCVKIGKTKYKDEKTGGEKEKYFVDKTVIDFASELSNLFNNCFEKYIQSIEKQNRAIEKQEDKIHVPSLSVAALIFYKSFPLYEAVEKSVSLLFKTAKSKKNCLAISLQKHAEQSVRLIIPSTTYDSVIGLQKKILEGNKEDILLSSLHKISMFSSVLNEASSDAQINNLFINLFDTASHEGNDFVHKTLPEYYNIFHNNKDLIFSDKTESGFADDFSALLRLMKFFIEKSGSKAGRKEDVKNVNL